MPILNMKTKELLTLETYKKRIELEDLDQVARGTYREWDTNKIEQEYYNQFLSDEEVNNEGTNDHD